MFKNIASLLTFVAVINLTLFSANAREIPFAESSSSTTSANNHSDARSQIENGTNPNYRRCVYISWAGIWWCFSWGEN